MTVPTWQKRIPGYLRTGLLILLSFSLSQCANEAVPQGGKKDETPPQAKRMKPANKSLHFSSGKIEITFDEFIKEGGFTQTLISPPPDKNPVYKVTGKTLNIKLRSPLRPSTTYTINFADDIKDVNEGNIAPNFTYVFSTGEFIDSQEVGGKVILAKDNSPADGVVVALYPAELKDAILSTKPYYFAKTNKSGEYQINNIRWGDYQIYALKDQNFNYLYDQPNELISFSDSTYHLTDTLKPKINLVVFEAANKTVQIIRAKSISPGFLQFAYTNPVSKFELLSEIKSENDFWYLNDTKDTVNYWLANHYTSKTTLFPVVNDTLTDTVRIELKTIAMDSLHANINNALSFTNKGFTRLGEKESREEKSVQELFKPLKIIFSRPVVQINESKALQISEDSTKKIYTPKLSLDEKSKMFITTDFDKIENTDYTLTIPDSMFRDMYGTWNQASLYRFRTNTKSEYGNINLTLKAASTEEHYIFQLLHGEGPPVKEISFSGSEEKKIKLENIPAGTYKVMVVEDRNRNGKWDTGDFKTKTQPEKIYTFQDSYALKGGWDLDVEVKF